MIRAYIKAVSAVSATLAVAATGLLVAAMVITCQMILMRYFFRQPTIWQTDFVVFCATAAIFVGAPYVLLKKGHVGVDVLEMILPPGPRRALRITAKILSLAFCAAMLIAAWILFHEAYTLGWRHSSVWAPRLWIPLLSLPIGFAMLCLQYVAEIARDVMGEEDEVASALSDEIRSAGELSAANAMKESKR